MKKAIWGFGFLLMVAALLKMGIGDLANWLQFITSIGAVYAFGEWLEEKYVNRPEREKSLAILHNNVNRLHDKHDALHEKIGG